MAGSTGKDVKMTVTSYEVMHPPSSNFMFLMCSTYSWMLLIWHVDFLSRGLRIPASSLATPYVIDPPLETMGLSETSFLWIWGSPKNLGEHCACWIYFLHCCHPYQSLLLFLLIC